MVETVQPVQPRKSLWQGFVDTVFHIFGAVNAVARTTEKTVGLAENEVDMLAKEQKLRFDRIDAETEAQAALLAQA